MKQWMSAGLLMAAGVACDLGPTPSESVDLLVEAVRARDSLQVAKFIDVQRVSESSIDPLIEAATRMGEADSEQFRQQTGGMGMEMLEQFRPMLAPLMEQLFWQMMLDPEGLEQGPMGRMLGDRSLPFEELGSAYQGVVGERRDGEEAVVSIQIGDVDSGAGPTTLDLRMARSENGWQVVALDNIGETIADAMSSGSR